MMKNRMGKRLLSGVLALAMVLGYVPVPTFAGEAEGLCEHHPIHTADCGYAAKIEGQDCTHAHSEECWETVTACVHTHGDCGYAEAVEGHGCDCEADENGNLVHTEGCGFVEAVEGASCDHVCSRDSGCITRALNCRHLHDEACGYVEAREASPCAFVCPECMEESTEPSQPEEPEAPTESEEPTEPKVTEAPTEPEEPTGPTESGEESIEMFVEAPMEEAEAEEVFGAFLSSLFFGDGSASYGTAAGRRLTGADKFVYDALRPEILKIAQGTRTSTVIPLSMGSYSPSDFDFQLVTDALYYDLPFEMFWYFGRGCRGSKINGEWKLEFLFLPAANYQPADYDADNPTIDLTEVRRAVKAADNAKAIAERFAALDDYEKLCAFADEICYLVEYDHDAAEKGTYNLNINPWTLVNVFDNDFSTKVVCEGYSEAFQYLCDLSTFRGDVEVYSATSIDHKWNIVHIEGQNYLMDVTHCDYGTTAYRGPKFFGGGSGSIDAGYVIGGFHYAYDAMSLSVYGTGEDSILKLAPTKYVPGSSDPDTPESFYTLRDGVLTIRISGDMEDYTYPLDSNPAPWYDRWEEITSVIIEEGVTSIGSNAFYGCKNLASVSIPGSVAAIHSSAFWGCSGLTQLSLPVGLTDIGYSAFYGCKGLTELTIPNGVTSIGWYAFECCFGLTTVSIPGSVSFIGGSAFESCRSLTAVVIPEGVTAILDNTFSGCASLAKVTLPQGLTTIQNAAFRECASLTSIVIPAGVTAIESGAFFGCTSLRAATIPGSVSTIGWGAFEGCADLTELTLSQGITTIGPYAFEDCTSLTSVTFPESLTTIRYFAFHGCSGLTQLTLPRNVSALGEYAFQDCTSLTSIRFLGDGIHGTNVFNTPVTAYYPRGNTTWTEEIRAGFGSTVTWVEACTNGIDHTEVIDPRKEPTCTETGLTEGKHCSVCGAVLVAQNTIPAKGHTEATDSGKAPTCTEPGLTEGKHCSVCNEVLVAQEVIPAKGHTEVIDSAVEPTCTETGLTEGKHCSVCEEVLTAQEVIPARGHTEVIAPGKAPTCTEEGLTEGKHCSVCRDVLVAQEPIPALGHTEVTDPGKEATCTEDGLTEGKHCSVCGEVLVAQEVVPALGHSFLDGACQRCGLLGGTCGEELSYTIVEGVLTITGTGAIPDFREDAPAPWYDHRSEITNLVLSEGLTTIGRSAFRGCTGLTNLVIPEIVTAIAPQAFYDCEKLVSVRFLGDGISGEDVFNTPVTAYYPERNTTWTEEIRDSFGSFVTWAQLSRAPRLVSATLTLNSNLVSGVDVGLREYNFNAIQGVTLYEYSASGKVYAEEPSARFLVEDGRLRTTEQVKNGTYKLKMDVTCRDEETYSYFLQVKVANSLPSVTVRQGGKFNLFYLDSTAELSITAPGQTIGEITLRDTDDFVLEDGTLRYSGNPAAKPDTKAALEVWLEGYQVPVKKAITISTVTTAPKLSFRPASTAFNTALNNRSTTLRVYNNTQGAYLDLTDATVRSSSSFVTVGVENGDLTLTLNGAKGGTATIYIRDSGWAQSVKLTHKVSVSTKAPTLKLGTTAVTLNTQLDTQQSREIPVTLSQSNISMEGLEVACLSTAKKGSAATEAAKLSFSYANGVLTVALGDEPPRPGTYSFSCKGTLNGTPISGTTLKVTVTNALPKVKLSASSVKLNRYLAGEEFARLKATITGGDGFTLTGFKECDWLTVENGIVQVRLPEGATDGKVKYALTPVLRNAETGQELELAPLSLTVQTYYSEKLSVTLSAKGKLDTQKPGSAIDYTVTKLTNCLGTIDSVTLAGQDAEKFQAALDTTGAKPVIHLTMQESTQYATKVTYRVQFRVTMCGKEVTLPAVSFKVSQTQPKVTAAPTTVTLYQAQSKPATGRLTLSTGEIGSVTVNAKTTAALRNSLAFSSTITGNTAQLTFALKNPYALTAGKSYTLYLDVFPKNNAANLKPIQVKLTVKVLK